MRKSAKGGSGHALNRKHYCGQSGLLLAGVFSAPNWAGWHDTPGDHYRGTGVASMHKSCVSGDLGTSLPSTDHFLYSVFWGSSLFKGNWMDGFVNPKASPVAFYERPALSSGYSFYEYFRTTRTEE